MAQFHDGKDNKAKVLNKREQTQRHSQNPLDGNSLKGQFNQITNKQLRWNLFVLPKAQGEKKHISNLKSNV